MLMELLPGVRVENFMRELARDERDALRVCFREAWLYVSVPFPLVWGGRVLRVGSGYVLIKCGQGKQSLWGDQFGYRDSQSSLG